MSAMASLVNSISVEIATGYLTRLYENESHQGWA